MLVSGVGAKHNAQALSQRSPGARPFGARSAARAAASPVQRAPPVGPGAGAAAERGVVRTVEPQLRLRARRQRGVDLGARLAVARRERVGVERAGEREERPRHAGERGAAAGLRHRRAERDERTQPRFGARGAAGDALAGEHLRRARTERVARHADRVEIDPLQQRPGAPALQFVEHERHVGHARCELLAARGAAHAAHAAGPEGAVAARMLQVQHREAGVAPRAAPHVAAVAAAAQAVRMQHERPRAGTCGAAQAQRQRARARGVVPFEVLHVARNGDRRQGECAGGAGDEGAAVHGVECWARNVKRALPLHPP
jgi:hypothetical protein